MAVILIAEDMEDIRILAESILEEAGHTSVTAKNALEGIALLDTEVAVDLLFTDLDMDDNPLAGIELAQRYRELHENAPVIYTSGAGVTDGTRAMFVPFAAFIAKPYTMQALVDAIERALAK